MVDRGMCAPDLREEWVRLVEFHSLDREEHEYPDTGAIVSFCPEMCCDGILAHLAPMTDVLLRSIPRSNTT